MKKNKIAGVVVLYFPTEDVKDNIETYIDFVDKLWIIDNTPNEIKLKINKTNIEYKKLYKNFGIATALNIAAREAIKEGYDWLLTMDQDSIFEEKSLEKLLITLGGVDKKKVGILSPFHKITKESNVYQNRLQEKEVAMTSGNLLNLNIYQKIGGFLEKLFIDEVDHEYCYRLNSYGYKIFQDNRVNLIHELGNIREYKILFKNIVVTNHSSLRRYYISRNMIYIIKNYRKKRLKYLFKLFISFIKIILFEKNKIEKIKAIFLGVKDGIFEKYGVKE